MDFPETHLAAEACLSGAEIERQLRKRSAALCALEGEPQLQAFLTGEFAGILDDCLPTAWEILSSAGLSFEQELKPEQRRLVPSDFGFHNALRDERGRLTFIDFEYFGWDDPVKLTADILLHPGTPVADRTAIPFPRSCRTTLRRRSGFRGEIACISSAFRFAMGVDPVKRISS